MFMMRRIVIANQKGGVGKTTTSVNLAVGLANVGCKTLLIDMDPQANTTFVLLGPDQSDRTIYSLLLDDGLTVSGVISQTRVDNLDIIPAEIDLASAEAELLAALDGRTRLRDSLMDAEQLPLNTLLLIPRLRLVS
jgi:chromosome partitioning protein